MDRTEPSEPRRSPKPRPARQTAPAKPPSGKPKTGSDKRWWEWRPSWPPSWSSWRPSWAPPGTLRWLIFLAAVAFCFLGYDWFRLSSIGSSRYVGQGWKFPTRVFADWKDYRVGDALQSSTLQRLLERAHYQRATKRPADPGRYRVNGPVFEIYLRAFTYPDRVEHGTPLTVRLQNGRVESLGNGFGGNAEGRGLLRIDPELLGEFADPARERRSYVPLDRLPRHLVLATIASEDRRFYHHWGLDLLGMGRATMRNVRARTVVEGGSTITQQLVKNFFLSHERSLWRKFHEALLAVLVELRYSKDQILEFYLNQIYLGQRGSWSVCGVEEASLYYFNKHAQELTVPEAALIVGIIPAPNRFSPYRDAEAAIVRRNEVLQDMAEAGYITKQDARKYRRTQMRFAANPPPATLAPYFVDYVRETLSKDIPESELSGRGFTIFTTLDSGLQEEGEKILRSGVKEADWRSPSGGAERDPAQGALLAIEPSTGNIRAMIGGRSYAESPFNRAVDSKRQPGSAFKPFVYTAALDSYFAGRRPPLTAATVLEDAPDTFQTDLGPWAPRNFENSYAGRVTAARAIARSLNVATVHLAQMVGLNHVVDTARSLGIQSRLRAVASLALGTSELSVLELTTAYATIANGGVLVEPTPVKAVLDRSGSVRWTPKRESRRVLHPETAYMATILLEGPVIYGTAAGIRSEYGFVRPAAGKTGTTDDENDAWFVGFTPDLATGVWVGCDKNRRLGLTGTQAAVPIWARFMDVAHRDRPLRDFEPPPDVVDVWIDGDTGYRAGPGCPHVMQAAFIRKTEPRQVCPVFHPVVWPDSLGGFTPDSTGTQPPDSQDEQQPSEPPEEEPPPPDDQGGQGL